MWLWHQQFGRTEWTHNQHTHIAHLSAATHSKLFECVDVIDKQVHQPEFVWKAYQDEEACGVQSHTVCLLLELLVQLQHSSDNSERGNEET